MNYDPIRVHRTLKDIFGYDAFRPGQQEVVDALAGQDVLAVMPTGAANPSVAQLPALLLPGITVVVSPLISLMQDQVQALIQMGVRAAYINSSLTENQCRKALANACDGMYKIVYVAPERLLTPGFLRFSHSVQISLLCVDEAHCVSQVDGFQPPADSPVCGPAEPAPAAGGLHRHRHPTGEGRHPPASGPAPAPGADHRL